MKTADQLQKNSLWYLDADNATANTNTGFQARRLVTEANNNNDGGGQEMSM